jgi:hypothetical protein
LCFLFFLDRSILTPCRGRFKGGGNDWRPSSLPIPLFGRFGRVSKQQQ